jgi:hypothetical protein
VDQCPYCGAHDSDLERRGYCLRCNENVGRAPARSRRPREDSVDEPSLSEPRTSRKAITAFVLSLLSFFVCILAVPAFILGIQSVGEINRSRGRITGTGLAIASLIASGLAVFVAVPTIMIALLVPAVVKVREAASRLSSSNNMKQQSLAMVNYEGDNQHFPRYAILDHKGKPLLSWRVEILPYLGEDALYNQFHLDEPWDSPHNLTLLRRMPRAYADPGDPQSSAQGLTHYRVLVGPHTGFPLDHALTSREIKNDPSQTIMIVEAADSVEWTRPDELMYDPNKPLPKLGIPTRRGPFPVATFDTQVAPWAADTPEARLRAAILIDNGKDPDRKR